MLAVYWIAIMTPIVTALVIIGYNHPQRYHIYIFIPLAVVEFILALCFFSFYYGYFFVVDIVMPYLDSTKIDEVRRSLEWPIEINKSILIFMTIINIAALVASLAKSTGIIGKNRGDQDLVNTKTSNAVRKTPKKKT